MNRRRTEEHCPKAGSVESQPMLHNGGRGAA